MPEASIAQPQHPIADTNLSGIGWRCRGNSNQQIQQRRIHIRTCTMTVSLDWRIIPVFAQTAYGGTGPHPLLQQTPLSVNPFVDLPKPPTLPHNYASIPSTLPPSSTNAAPAPSNPDLPAYVTSSTGFAAHPASIINQNRALLDQISSQRRDGQEKVKKWEQDIRERELQEKRRRAPGWLDSESKLLQPAKKPEERQAGGKVDLMDQPEAEVDIQKSREQNKTANELGDAMDRAFGRSEMA
jgi:hypothetical protein